MAESKKERNETEKKKPKQRVKTTTGAWWKSKVLQSDQEGGVTPAEPQPPLAAPGDAGDRKQSSPRKSSRGGRRKSQQKPSSSADRSQAAADTALSADAAKAGPPSAGSEQHGETGEKTASRETAGPETGEAEQQTAGTGAQGEEQKEKKRGGRSRGRRGGRKKGGSRSDREHAGGQEQADGREKHAQKEPAPEKEQRTSPDGREYDQPREGKSGVAAKHGEHEPPQPVVKLLINADEPEECRLALLEDGRLESLHVTTVSRVHTRNNIYKGRVVAIEPNLQAAFIDYGTEKNGFLAFSEIHPEYYKQELTPEIRQFVDNQQWKKLSISDVLVKGQEMLVQVVKEEVGRKGANLTTYLSLPGRNVVLMPGSDSEGVSRKISGEERRNKLREIMNSLNIPEGIGWIVRTASVEVTKTALTRDVRFLLKLWQEIKAKGQHLEGVGLLYQDHNCVMRFLREQFDPATQEILVDDEAALEKVKEFTMMLPAKQRKVKVRLHRGARPIFNQYSVEDQIESIYQPRVNLPSGGSIVIEPTEALVSIDVNSGSTAKGKNFEETIFQANMEAATELARQLRLRDLGGLIVVDFIDMRSSKNVREVEKQVKNAMKRDKAKVDISRISRFGLMQISRQKLGSPIESGNYRICEHCRGRGTVKSVETMALFYLRRIHTGASRKQVVSIDCRFPLDVAQYLLNNKRQEIIELEEKYDTRVNILADPSLKPMEHDISFVKAEKEEGGKKQS